MKRLVAVLAVPSLLAFAPAPPPRGPFPADPDRAIALYEKQAPAARKKGGKAALELRKKLLEHLDRLAAGAVKAGTLDRASAIRDRIALVESLDAQNTLGKTPAGDALRKASLNGRYRQLLRVLHMPTETANYGEFREYGFWNGNSYNGLTDLPPGFWVYSAPRWFLWKENTGN
jgi:hypothetical protein